MPQFTGRVVITINGKRYRSKEGATLDTGGKSREPAISDSGVDGFVEKYVHPSVEFAINHGSGVSLTELQSITDATLIYETDTGQIFTVRQAWCATPPKMSKGEVTLTFQGVECIEG